jgi:riboflavin synthase
MFTGIIELIGKITRIETKGSNRIFTIQASLAKELKVSDSIAIDGCCLTVIDTQKDTFNVEAVSETLKMTTLAQIKTNSQVNLERARLITERFEGHIVQGHIDEKASISNIRKTQDSVAVEIELSKDGMKIVVEKGSIAIDGISLTIANIRGGTKFSVNIIPYTFNNTTLKHKRIGDWVNIEFDVIGKYVRKYINPRS